MKWVVCQKRDANGEQVNEASPLVPSERQVKTPNKIPLQTHIEMFTVKTIDNCKC